MTRNLLAQTAVYVVGIGMYGYRRPSDISYVTMGTTAIREALSDAGIKWADVESMFVGSGKIGMAAAPTLARYLGRTGIPVVQVESASASGSVAFRQAVLDVASGRCDVSVAVGVDKAEFPPDAVSKAGVRGLVDGRIEFHTMFALKTEHWLRERSLVAADLAPVAVKNHRNGALNPYAQRRKARTVDEVLAPPYISGSLTRLQCTPVGEGSAAVVVASADALRRLDIDPQRCVQVRASVHQTQPSFEDAVGTEEQAVTRAAAREAYEACGIGPGEVDIVELHDAFAVEEPMYLEAMGICAEGRALSDLADGALDLGGRVAVSPSGGLLAMGHPVGPTGVGQVCESVRQLRGEAGPRQHPDARTALVHMVGVGGVCAVHILQNATSTGVRP
ncbi:thiolase family protein [Mycolicibacterium goodii]|uniref:Thiolase n=1 Tax=Mycolicibacterium goodii TaxID=134601 RepID=A0A0K0X2C6_MYCGD|nr:thiolase [Mycolicibacterium goodii]